MSKTLLIHTLGNRDLQFKGSVPGAFMSRYLEPNSEDHDYYIIRKGGDEPDASFRSYSARVLAELKAKTGAEILPHLHFTILEQIISFIFNETSCSQLDEVWLLPTKQNKPFIFDTDKIGLIAKEFLISRLTKNPNIDKVQVRYLKIAGNNRDVIVQQVDEICSKIQHEQVFISANQGLPEVTFAFTLMSILNGYTCIKAHPFKMPEIDGISAYQQLIQRKWQPKPSG